MFIVMSGASGFIGSALTKHLESHGHRVTPLVRVGTREVQGSIRWNPRTGDFDYNRLDGVDAIIHLAGESIMGPWLHEKKRQIRDSRGLYTENLSKTIARLNHPPSTMIVASAMGYYGNRGEETLTEESASGTGFLADVCKHWETATLPATQAGVRVIHLRMGAVLDKSGGTLKKAISLQKIGLSLNRGDSSHYMSWIALNDAVRAITFLLERRDLKGPFNLVSPEPVTTAHFSEVVAANLKQPLRITVPKWLLRLAPGGMADELIFSSQKGIPQNLTRAGFEFECSRFENIFEPTPEESESDYERVMGFPSTGTASY